MERLTRAHINDLKIGDRFYKLNDKKQTVFVKVQHQTKTTLYMTYRNWALEAAIADNKNCKEEWKERMIKPMTASTMVVFLRHAEIKTA